MHSHSKKILITGGTGFIGQALCNSLLKRGYFIYILTRQTIKKRDNRNSLWINHLDAIPGTIDGIINLAGETIGKKWTTSAKKTIYNSRILTTQALIDFIRSQRTKPTVFISASGVGYYGTSLEKTWHEDSPTDDTGFASMLCHAWEQEASKAVTLGIRTVILRIGPVLDRSGGILASLVPLFYWGFGSQIGDGNQWLSWIDRTDLIRLILFAIEHPKLAGPVNATAPYPVTYQVFSRALAKTLKRPCILKIPARFLRCILGQMAQEILLSGQKVLPTKALDEGFSFCYPTLEASLQRILRGPFA